MPFKPARCGSRRHRSKGADTGSAGGLRSPPTAPGPTGCRPTRGRSSIATESSLSIPDRGDTSSKPDGRCILTTRAALNSPRATRISFGKCASPPSWSMCRCVSTTRLTSRGPSDRVQCRARHIHVPAGRGASAVTCPTAGPRGNLARARPTVYLPTARSGLGDPPCTPQHGLQFAGAAIVASVRDTRRRCYAAGNSPCFLRNSIMWRSNSHGCSIWQAWPAP